MQVFIIIDKKNLYGSWVFILPLPGSQLLDCELEIYTHLLSKLIFIKVPSIDKQYSANMISPHLLCEIKFTLQQFVYKPTFYVGYFGLETFVSYHMQVL